MPIVDMDSLDSELTVDEGKRRRGYKCSSGFWTIGIGHNTEGKDLSDRAIRVIFEDDVSDAIKDLDSMWVGWRGLSERRKRALINFSFQLGYSRMRGFIKFWAALRAHDFNRAADEMKDSLWFRQTQESRTSRVIQYVREG
jgi:lysozyme